MTESKKICILVDVSASMAGYKIESVISSVQSLLEKLDGHLPSVKIFAFSGDVTEVSVPISDIRRELSIRSSTGDCFSLAEILNRTFANAEEMAFVIYGDGIGYFSEKCSPELFGQWVAHTSLCHVFRVGEDPSEEDDLFVLARAFSQKVYYHRLSDDPGPIAWSLNSFVEGEWQ